ncbi:unnamed protein product, partial [Arctia plantaginis]
MYKDVTTRVRVRYPAGESEDLEVRPELLNGQNYIQLTLGNGILTAASDSIYLESRCLLNQSDKMLALILGVVTIFLYYWWKWTAKLRRLKATTKLPPIYPGALPILGHAHLLVGNTT